MSRFLHIEHSVSIDPTNLLVKVYEELDIDIDEIEMLQSQQNKANQQKLFVVSFKSGRQAAVAEEVYDTLFEQIHKPRPNVVD